LSNDPWQIARLEFEGGLYWDDKLGPYMPANMLRNRLATGARLIRAGKKIERGCRSPNSCRSGNRPLRRRVGNWHSSAHQNGQTRELICGWPS
jgi:hypothetical protein